MEASDNGTPRRSVEDSGASPEKRLTPGRSRNAQAISEAAEPLNGRALETETRETLRFELNAALLQFVQAERPVVLEGFGLVQPIRKKLMRTHHLGDWGIVREETIQSIEFEKCQDTTGINLSDYPRLVDTRELIQTIYSKLPLPLQLRWSERELRRLTLQFIREIRSEVVRAGYSNELRGIGQLFAVHNRQGETESDWFAGSDIFLLPRHSRPLSLGAARRFSRPVLENALELWEAYAGKPAWQGQVSISATLKAMGFPVQVLEDYQLSLDSLSISMFLEPAENAESQTSAGALNNLSSTTCIFVSDGLRSASLTGQPRHKLRHELVARLPLRALQPGFDSLQEPATGLHVASGRFNFQPPAWLARLFAPAALLLASDRVNPLRASSALAIGKPLTGASECRLTSLLLTPCATFSAQQLASDGPFSYATILGLTADEVTLLTARGREHLFAILESRGLNQITNPARSSTLSRGFVQLRKEFAAAPTRSGVASRSNLVSRSSARPHGPQTLLQPTRNPASGHPSALSQQNRTTPSEAQPPNNAEKGVSLSASPEESESPQDSSRHAATQGLPFAD